MYLHDIPQRILPKFADDLVAIAVDSDFQNIAAELQLCVDELVN